MKLNGMTLRRTPGVLVLFAAVFAAAGAAIAAPLPINNHSFESATYTGANSWTNDLTDTNPETSIEWQGRDGNGDGCSDHQGREDGVVGALGRNVSSHGV